MLQKILHRQGLTSKEISIYSYLLEFGEQPASIIARKTALPRSGCYLILAKLCRHGLIIQIIKNHLTYYAVNNPVYLLEQIQKEHTQEIQQIENLKSNLSIKTPSIKPFHQNSCAHYYSGQTAISNLIEQLLATASFTTKIILSTQHFTKFIAADLLTPAGQGQFILSSQSISRFNSENLTRKLPASFNLGVDLIINEQEVALICLPENFALLIESPLIAACQSKIFDFLWKFSRTF